MSTTKELKPADIICQQLGGMNRLAMMIGATNFFSDDDGYTLRFNFKMCKAAKLITITLNGLDLYDIKFIKPGRLNRKTFEMSPAITAGEFENVHYEDLQGVIEDFTGLYLNL